MPEPIPDCEEILGNSLPEFQKCLMGVFVSNLFRLDMMLLYKLKMRRADHVADGPLEKVIFDVLQYCQAEGKLTGLLIGVCEFSENPQLKLFRQKIIPASDGTATGSEISTPVPMNPASTLAAIARAPQIYRLDSLLETLERSALAVGRIVSPKTKATGFLVGSDLLLTCFYVIESSTNWNAVQVEFPSLNPDPGQYDRVVSLVANGLVAASRIEDLDYALIRLAAPVGSELVGEHERGWLTLSSAQPIEPDNLIQFHFPQGGPLAVSFVSTVPGGQNSRIQYDYATRPGSGGAPSIDDNRQVVAIHEKHIVNSRGEGVRADLISQDLTSKLARKGIALSRFQPQEAVHGS